MSNPLDNPKDEVCVYGVMRECVGIAEKDFRTAEGTLLLLKIQSQTDAFAVHVLACVSNRTVWEPKVSNLLHNFKPSRCFIRNTSVHSYYLLQLGSAPRWASFLENIAEELHVLFMKITNS